MNLFMNHLSSSNKFVALLHFGLIAIIFSSTLFSCGTEKEHFTIEDVKLYPYKGNGSFSKNGLEETAFVYATKSESPIKFTLTIDRYDTISLVPYRNESLVIGGIPLDTGVYKIYNSKHDLSNQNCQSIYMVFIDHDDLIDARYDCDSSQNNYIEILSIDGNVINGEFQVCFQRDTSRKSRPSSPLSVDSVNFTLGQFEVILQ